MGISGAKWQLAIQGEGELNYLWFDAKDQKHADTLPASRFSLNMPASGGSLEPLTLRICPTQQWVLGLAELQAVSFVEPAEGKEGAPGSFSSIESGTLELAGRPGRQAMAKYQRIAFDALSGTQAVVAHVPSVNALPGLLSMSIEGRARRVLSGVGTGVNDLTPRLIEAWYFNEESKLMLGFITWLWGLIWGLRALLRPA